MTSAAERVRTGSPWIVTMIVLALLPFVLSSFWTDRIAGWIPLAIAAVGLNLLTGYNGQISIGHGALYGAGAYAAALIVNNWRWGFVPAIIGAAVICFVVGVVVGLPALRIKGLALALVTLALATLFPQIIEQFEEQTGGSSGLSVTTLEETRRRGLTEVPVRFEPPEWTGLDSAQWQYFFFLIVAVVCVVLARNIVASRVGRSMVAIRDNEIAAEVSGVNVSRVKVLTFGVSSALAGVGGALLALGDARVTSTTFNIVLSINILVAVVVGGPASIAGPLIGAVILGVFTDVITPELPESLSSATPLILGLSLISLMLTAPGGIVGLWRGITARISGRRTAAGQGN